MGIIRPFRRRSHLEAIKERKKLRDTLLEGLYQHHFNHTGQPMTITVTDTKVEEELAYKYLEDKGLIHTERQGRDNLCLEITTAGIDHVEDSVETK